MDYIDKLHDNIITATMEGLFIAFVYYNMHIMLVLSPTSHTLTIIWHLFHSSSNQLCETVRRIHTYSALMHNIVQSLQTLKLK